MSGKAELSREQLDALEKLEKTTDEQLLLEATQKGPGYLESLVKKQRALIKAAIAEAQRQSPIALPSLRQTRQRQKQAGRVGKSVRKPVGSPRTRTRPV
jgi:hypothetical protein